MNHTISHNQGTRKLFESKTAKKRKKGKTVIKQLKN